MFGLCHTKDMFGRALWGLRLLATVPEQLQIVPSYGSQFILTGERKTTSMNSAAIVQDVGRARATRSPAKHALKCRPAKSLGQIIRPENRPHIGGKMNYNSAL